MQDLYTCYPDDIFAQFFLIQTLIHVKRNCCKINDDKSALGDCIKDNEIPSKLATELLFLSKKSQEAFYQCVISLVAQIISLILIISALGDRKLSVGCLDDYIARMIFSIVIQYCIRKDINPMNFSAALNELNLYSHNNFKKSLSYIVRNIRKSFNHILLVIIPFYIYTTDPEGEEGHLDLVQNFTALYIMCDIDQLLTLPSQLVDNFYDQLKSIGPNKMIIFKFSEKPVVQSNLIMDTLQFIVSVSSVICVYSCKFIAFFFLPVAYFVAIVKT